MLGYKIATHVTQYGNDIDGSYYCHCVKVLVVLDIPDDVKRTTPEMRYSKVPLGLLTNNELNEWFNEAQKYKTFPDSLKLFHDIKNFADECATDAEQDRRFEIAAIYGHYIHARKCRAEKAKVVRIIDLTDGTPYDCAESDFDCFTTYRTGETVVPDAYDDDYLNICSHGIHYFESPEVAMLYYAKDPPPSEASAFLNHAEELLERLRKGGDI